MKQNLPKVYAYNSVKSTIYLVFTFGKSISWSKLSWEKHCIHLLRLPMLFSLKLRQSLRVSIENVSLEKKRRRKLL